MKLYKWSSDFLQEYVPGYIIVVAENVDEARMTARKNLIPYIKDRYDWLFDSKDEDDLEEIDRLRRSFERDIEYPPDVIEAGCLFIRGSQ